MGMTLKTQRTPKKGKPRRKGNKKQHSRKPLSPLASPENDNHVTSKQPLEFKKNKGTQYSFHLVFNEVNGGVNKLVVGALSMKSFIAKDRKTIKTHFKSKAMDFNYTAKNTNNNPYDVRMDSIDELFRKIKRKDKVKIVTADPYLIAISNGTAPEESTEARARFNKYAENISISVLHANEHAREEHMELAKSIATLKVNSLKSSNNHSKGFHR